MMTTLELDHIFVFVDPAETKPGGRVFERLSSFGLRSSFERRHVGQGTANLCYAFDNAYLELLFVADEDELKASPLNRAWVAARSSWRQTGASPFGIACRGALPGESWAYRNPDFPPSVSIDISAESSDAATPFLFSSPGKASPSAWSDGRAGRRQTEAGFANLTIDRLKVSQLPKPGGALDGFHRACVVRTLEVAEGKPEMLIGLGSDLRLSLPLFTSA